MRDIKFSILLQHDETGRIVERVFSYADIFNGTAKAEIGKLKRYAVIARREYIGLPDKNGKDIYEDDIVLGFDSGHYGELQKMRIEYRLHPFIGFYMVPADGLRPHLFGEGDDIEIIGNIYENPELLEDEGDPHA